MESGKSLWMSHLLEVVCNGVTTRLSSGAILQTLLSLFKRKVPGGFLVARCPSPPGATRDGFADPVATARAHRGRSVVGGHKRASTVETLHKCRDQWGYVPNCRLSSADCFRGVARAGARRFPGGFRPKNRLLHELTAVAEPWRSACTPRRAGRRSRLASRLHY